MIKKNLGTSFFKFATPATKPHVIPNYVNLTISKPPCNYNFRDIKKDKWIAGMMKFKG